jgi:site-specific DNA-methyltransferase (adenine-specific)
VKLYAEGNGWKIWQGKAEDLLSETPKGRFDLCLTDPPYGVGMANRTKIGGDGRRFTRKTWDAKRPAPEVFRYMRHASQNQIIWGGNYFADLLPPSRCWLIWHKRPYPNKMSFADCEIAYTSLNQNAKVLPLTWAGAWRAYKETDYPHPTQKPTRLFDWCLTIPKKPPGSVIDPFLGTGTTIESSIKAGIYVEGGDMEEEYCEIAAKRALLVEEQKRNGLLDGQTETSDRVRGQG